MQFQWYSTLNIKRATIEDSPRIHQIALAAFLRDQVSKRLIDEQLAAGRVTYLLAESAMSASAKRVLNDGTVENNPIVGFLSYRAILDEVDLSFLAVDPAFQGLGIARELMQAFCEQNYGQTAYLEVAENNLPARRLYEKFGFEIYARRDGYYHDGQTAILMEKNL
ncbi:GNAT family N-acetyltransferase [Fructobacillus americanaquae]|uniref:GNAT family N-acetyltransferase n=1 Tax=Fructobacillus americanaquae TaxID=2940302 RepID=A0ABY5BYT9_9LACO|nr:GNAT family N-acetyltransferase [Fructobacillus americanaquae]USS91674.1 GNAT family N-acetyltransferase [Fructobacillus americanaquae]